MGQNGEPFILWLHWAARFWLHFKYVRQNNVILIFSRGQIELLMSQQCLPSWSVLGILCSTLLWWFESFFDLVPSLCWTCMCAYTASRSKKLESLSDVGPGWQVLGVSGRQAGEGFPQWWSSEVPNRGALGMWLEYMRRNWLFSSSGPRGW